MVRKIMPAVIFLLVLVASLIAAEMTADDLIGKYLTACGGEQNMRALKSLTMKGTMFAQGQSLELKISYVMPSQSYLMEIGMGGMVMQTVGANGKDAWTKNPMGAFYMSGKEKESTLKQAELFPLLDYKKSGAKVKYLGEDLVKGAKAYKLEYVGTDNDTTIYYFDATTFNAVKEKTANATVLMSDYRKVGDLTLPYKINIQSAAESMMMTIDTVAVNPTISDSLFVMPKDAKSLDSLKAMMKQAGGGAGGGQ